MMSLISTHVTHRSHPAVGDQHAAGVAHVPREQLRVQFVEREAGHLLVVEIEADVLYLPDEHPVVRVHFPADEGGNLLRCRLHVLAK